MKDTYYIEEKLYWLWLAESVPVRKADRLLAACGSIEEVYETVAGGAEPEIAGISQEDWMKLRQNASMEELREKFEDYRRQGIGFCHRGEEVFPDSLRQIYQPPGWLYYKGSLPVNSCPVQFVPEAPEFAEGEPQPKQSVPAPHRLAVVGARACTAFGARFSEEIARDLAEQGVEIISGLAIGIDGNAQKGALAGGGATYAVLGCGVDICYPGSNRKLYDAILERGGILSEFPPGTAPLPHNFPIRNRIISGLAEGVLVVEARKRSGSIITAELGLDQGKNIYAVPGRPGDVVSEGCNYLIQNGAKLVQGAVDILSDYDLAGGGNGTSFAFPKVLLETAEKIVYACLRLEPRHINQIQQESGIEVPRLLSILLKLELLGYAEQVSMGYYISAHTDLHRN